MSLMRFTTPLRYCRQIRWFFIYHYT
jgi:hypothetical protein